MTSGWIDDAWRRACVEILAFLAFCAGACAAAAAAASAASCFLFAFLPAVSTGRSASTSENSAKMQPR